MMSKLCFFPPAFFSLGLKQLDEEQRSRRQSSPISPYQHQLHYHQQQRQEGKEEEKNEEDIPLSEIIAPLQNGGLGSIEDLLGRSKPDCASDPEMLLFACFSPDPLLVESLSPGSGTEVKSEVESEAVSPTKSEPSIGNELLEVKLKDASSMLADLDTEVSTMVGHVIPGSCCYVCCYQCHVTLM